ncbi:Retrovirus-related Pol polyprotein from type-1 retrotransposable element R1 2 [Eumeta japonica]|uniref:Retrovirus-related Pol polyprotein from type-1 retrotransposable element R1 2 n=1 Tax=Eumeta variegata TaxID=151549 RepID=A0A4C1T0L3_EUMVA|nr:Retrovirus-related Pol polyprotein from type-1 retrotransposable element R1 2 [Eumeta japonica]
MKYDTEKGPKEYKITGGVPQDSVLGPLLWNIMYDVLLKVLLPTEIKLVAYADDVAVVIVAKHLDEINLAFEKAFERINQWMDPLQVEEQELTSQPYIRYMGVTIDARLNFKQHVEHVSAKASTLQCDAAKKGRWTYRLIPQIDVWLNLNHGEVNYYLTQMVSGHGCFRAYLHSIKRDDLLECTFCPAEPEDAEDVFFVCPRFNLQCDELEKILNQRIQPETLVEASCQHKLPGTLLARLLQKFSRTCVPLKEEEQAATRRKEE